jgi:hypothetical protein
MSLIYTKAFNRVAELATSLDKHESINWFTRIFVGAANMLSGSTQFFLGHAFKCSKDREYNVVQSAAHIERGIRVFKQGVGEFAPGAIGIALGIWAGKHITAKYP